MNRHTKRRFTALVITAVMMLSTLPAAPLNAYNTYEGGQATPTDLATPTEMTCPNFLATVTDISADSIYNTDAADATVIASGTVGAGGAPWRLYDDGRLAVDSGFVNWTSLISPWNAHLELINTIEFHGLITAGTSLAGLFSGLRNTTAINGLHYFDTRNVTSMAWMFFGSNNLTSLDISCWDTNRVTSMNGMFIGTNSLRELTLGENFRFVGNTGLPDVPSNETYTGFWTNGTYVFTTQHLTALFDGSIHSGTWTWQSRSDVDFIASGSFDNGNVDGETIAGAVWHLYGDGRLEVDGGFLNWTGLDSPWDTYRKLIDIIEFLGPITAGTSLRWLFSGLNVTCINGLHYFDTSRVTNMWGVFENASNLTGLDLSVWDTGRVTNMMSMLRGAESLRELTLGENFRFAGNPGLPAVPSNETYSGFWTNGTFAFTSSHLTALFDGSIHAGTWVWQARADVDFIASGSFSSGVVDGETILGAVWRLYGDGRLLVDEGFIQWTSIVTSPWQAYLDYIEKIIFTGPITAGPSLNHLFGYLSNVTVIEGLHYFDTSSVTSINALFWDMTDLTGLDLSGWDTGHVTNMNNVFGLTRSLTELNISGWDTANVTTMFQMFAGASSLTSLDLSSFDTSNVTSMRDMFRETENLRKLALGENFRFIGNTGLPNVQTNETYTGFWTDGATKFITARFTALFDGSIHAGTWTWQRQPDIPIIAVGAFANGNVDGETIFGAVWRLYGDGRLAVCGGFLNWAGTGSSPWHANRDLISIVEFTEPIIAGTSLRGLFSGLSNVTEINGLGHFNTSGTRIMWSMFRNASSLTTLDLSGWDTSNVDGMDNMFSGASGLTAIYGISGWDTGNVIYAPGMFHNASSLISLDLSGWDVRNVRQMQDMFWGADSLAALDLSGWHTGNVTNMANMFNRAGSLVNLDLSGWDVRNVRQMQNMFNNASSLVSLNLSGWDTSGVTNMDGMFGGASSLREFTMDEHFRFLGNPELPDGIWQNNEHLYSTAQLTELGRTQSIAGTWVLHAGNIVFLGRFADGVVDGEVIPGAEWWLNEDGRVEVGGGFMQWDANLSPWWLISDVEDLNFSTITFTRPIIAGESLMSLFVPLIDLTAVYGLENIDTSRVRRMDRMFESASSLVSLDLSGWDTSKVTDMGYMFSRASSLVRLDLSGWDTGNVTDMSGMFWRAENLTALSGMSDWNTGSVTNMSRMFSDASSLTALDLSRWDTRNVTNMIRTFWNASGLVSLNLSGWDTGGVMYMNGVFGGIAAAPVLGGRFSFVSNPGLPSGANYSYELFLTNPLQLYSEERAILFIKTNNPDPSTFTLALGGLSGFTSVRIPRQWDVPFTGNNYIYRYVSSGDRRVASNHMILSVVGGYIIEIDLRTSGGIYTVTLLEGSVPAAAIDLHIRNWYDAFDAYMDEVIANYTNNSMTFHEKMAAITQYILDNYRYPTNTLGYCTGRGFLVPLLAERKSLWHRKMVDSWGAPGLLGSFAIRLGGTTGGGEYIHATILITYDGETRRYFPTPWPHDNTRSPASIIPFDFMVLAGIHSITVTAVPHSGGTARAKPSSAPQDAIINLTATPNSGYVFQGWEVVSGDVEIADSSFTMPSRAVTVDAIFRQLTNPVRIGDANGDGRVTSADGTRLARYLAGHNITIDRRAMDLDGNDVVDGADLILLANWLMGHGVPPIIGGN